MPQGRNPRTDDASTPREEDSPPATVRIPHDGERDPSQDLPAKDERPSGETPD